MFVKEIRNPKWSSCQTPIVYNEHPPKIIWWSVPLHWPKETQWCCKQDLPECLNVFFWHLPTPCTSASPPIVWYSSASSSSGRMWGAGVACVGAANRAGSSLQIVHPWSQPQQIRPPPKIQIRHLHGPTAACERLNLEIGTLANSVSPACRAASGLDDFAGQKHLHALASLAQLTAYRVGVTLQIHTSLSES